MRTTHVSHRRPRHLARWAALAAGILAVTALGACGSDDDGSTPSPSTVEVPASEAGAPETTDGTAAPSTEPTATEQTEPTPTEATSSSKAAATTTASDPETTFAVATEPHTVVHAMGETEVVADPQRVVVLDSSFLDAAIALGVTPIGAPEGAAGRGLPAYLGADVLAEVAIIGETNNPNLEVIASMQPDLIIGAKVRHEALYDTLSQIAPTVMSESSGTNWTNQVRLTADALGRQEQAESLLAGFEARAVAVGEAIGAPGKTAAIVRFIPDQTRLYGPETFSGSVLTLVGFDLGTNETKGYDPAFSMALISEEQIDLIDADVIFTTTLADGGSARPAFEALWNTLPAVQNGMRFDIEDDVWMTGIGVIGANLILDDLGTFLGA